MIEFKKYNKEEIDTAITEVDKCKNCLEILAENDLISESEIIKIQDRMIDDVLDIVNDMYEYCKKELKEELESELERDYD